MNTSNKLNHCRFKARCWRSIIFLF